MGIDHRTNSPKFLIAAHQTFDRSAAPNKTNDTAIFDNRNVKKNFVLIDGISYTRDSVNVGYFTNIYLHQNRDPKLFIQEHFVEPLSSPFVTYPDMENF